MKDEGEAVARHEVCKAKSGGRHVVGRGAAEPQTLADHLTALHSVPQLESSAACIHRCTGLPENQLMLFSCLRSQDRT